MAKSVPRKSRDHGKKHPVISRHTFTFLFHDPAVSGITPEYLDEFARKIRHEHTSRSHVYCISREAAPSDGEHQLVSYLDPKALGEKASQGEGYAVILEAQAPVRLINPDEFFRLPLPGEWSQRIYYEIVFSGKERTQQSGLIIPFNLLHYLCTLLPPEQMLDTGMIRMILGKLDFKREKVLVNQEAPFDHVSPARPPLRERLKLNLAWNTTLPWTERREPSLRNHFYSREHPLFRFAFFITALAIFIILPILSLDAGLSGDDEKHYNHAVKVYRYFTEDDPAALDDPKHKLNYYGQSFDFFTYLFIRLFNLGDHPYEARHVMVAITGAAAMLVTGLLVRLFSGYAGGWLALVLMFLSPRFLGHSFNNPMDVPFALGYIFTIYHIILFLKKLPRISARSAFWIAIGIGWTNGIRIGGLILIPYLFMFAGLYLLIHRWPWTFFSAGWWRLALRGLATLVIISVSGYLLSLLTWPYALQDVINHPAQAFKIMSNIQVSIRVVYDGIVQWSDHLPWHYIPKNVLLTVPVIILLGWFASTFTWYFKSKEKQGFWYLLLWFAVLFPVVFIIFRESNVYGGWRHMMFIYPPMLALSAMALSALLEKLRLSRIRYAVILLIAAGLIHPLRHIIRNHPNTYIYFNEWSGGINNTYGTFETDYYTNSLGPATRYFLEEILPKTDIPKGKPVRVVSNASIHYYFRNHRERVEPFYSRYYDRGKYDWDYAILYCNYIHPYQLNNGLWPPKNTIHEIKVDNVTVAAIVERRNKDDFYGSQLLSEGIRDQDPEKLNQAIQYLEQALEYDENNETAYLEIGNAFTAFLRFERARTMMDRLLAIYPRYDKALNLKGYTYLVEADVKKEISLVDEAIRFINQAIQSNYKFFSGYFNLGLCYAMKNDKDNAVYYFRQAIRFNSRFVAAYEKLAELYDYYGDTELAASVRAQLNRIRR